MTQAKNVLGEPLQSCCFAPVTGFTRTGFCDTGPADPGAHTVCAQMTKEFLEFSRAHGNDLTAPAPEFHFPGLRPGNRWCICAARWKEAYDAGVAPPVILAATHVATLEYAALDELKEHALDLI